MHLLWVHLSPKDENGSQNRGITVDRITTQFWAIPAKHTIVFGSIRCHGYSNKKEPWNTEGKSLIPSHANR
jgi:hypothetical protein